MKLKKRCKQTVAWVLAATVLISGFNPGYSVSAEELDTGTSEEVITQEATSEEVTSEEVTVASEEKTSETTGGEETTETSSKKTSKVKEDSTEKSTKTPKETKEKTGKFSIKLSEGGTATVVVNGTKNIIEKKGSSYVSENNEDNTDLSSLVSNDYVVFEETVGSVVSVEVSSKENYKIESYSKVIDNGKEEKINSFENNSYKTSYTLDEKGLSVSVGFSKVSESTESSEDGAVVNSTEAGDTHTAKIHISTGYKAEITLPDGSTKKFDVDDDGNYVENEKVIGNSKSGLKVTGTQADKVSVKVSLKGSNYTHSSYEVYCGDDEVTNESLLGEIKDITKSIPLDNDYDVYFYSAQDIDSAEVLNHSNKYIANKSSIFKIAGNSATDRYDDSWSLSCYDSRLQELKQVVNSYVNGSPVGGSATGTFKEKVSYAIVNGEAHAGTGSDPTEYKIKNASGKLGDGDFSFTAYKSNNKGIFNNVRMSKLLCCTPNHGNCPDPDHSFKLYTRYSVTGGGNSITLNGLTTTSYWAKVVMEFYLKDTNHNHQEARFYKTMSYENSGVGSRLSIRKTLEAGITPPNFYVPEAIEFDLKQGVKDANNNPIEVQKETISIDGDEIVAGGVNGGYGEFGISIDSTNNWYNVYERVINGKYINTIPAGNTTGFQVGASKAVNGGLYSYDANSKIGTLTLANSYKRTGISFNLYKRSSVDNSPVPGAAMQYAYAGIENFGSAEAGGGDTRSDTINSINWSSLGLTDNNGAVAINSNSGWYGTYFIRESQAPYGYEINNTIYAMSKFINDAGAEEVHYYSCTPNGNGSYSIANIDASYTATNGCIMPEKEKRGSVAITKLAAETGSGPVVGTDFKGVKYGLYANQEFNFNNAQGGAVHWNTNDLLCEISANPVTGVADLRDTASVTNHLMDEYSLPTGNYYLQEVGNNSTNFENDDSNKYIFRVYFDAKHPDGHFSLVANSPNNTTDTPGNTLKRVDIKFNKIRSDSGKALGNVPFLIECLTTGESHIIFTDENGNFNSKDFLGTNGRNTRDVLSSKEKTVEGCYKTSDIREISGSTIGGVWFGLKANADGTTSSTFAEEFNKLGSFPIRAQYRVTELKCEGNSHYKSLYTSDVFTLSEEDYNAYKTSGDVVVIGKGGNVEWTEYDPDAIVNEYQPPTIKTAALDSQTKTQLVAKGKKVNVIDTVSLDHLEVGHKYGIKSYVMDKESKDVMSYKDGTRIESNKEFVADLNKMDVKVEFEINSEELQGKTGVIQLDLYDLTEAKDDGVDDPYVVDYLKASERDFSIESQTIYIPRITTNAYDVSSGTHVGTPTYVKIGFGDKDKNTSGDASTSGDANTSGDATASGNETSSGNSTGTTSGDASGEDTSSDTTVTVTSSENPDGSDSFDRDVTVNIKDKITMYNFLKDEKYIVTGQVYRIELSKEDPKVKEVKNKVAEITLKDNVTKTIENTEEDSVTVDYEIKDRVNTRDGAQYVVYEQVWYQPDEDSEPVLVASHEDAEDENQQISLVGLYSFVQDLNTKTNTSVVSEAGNTIKLQDRLFINNAIVGEKYSLTNELLYKDTGEPVIIGDKPVKETREIEAKATSFEELFEYNVDTSSLRGKDVVFHEYIEYKGVKVNDHSDLKNPNETLTFADVTTKAFDEKTLISLGSLDSTVIKDTVTVKNSQKGVPQTVKGILMDKATGEYLGKAEGYGPFESKVDITPKERDYEVEVSFSIPNSKILEGKDIVCYESVYLNNTEITFHKDINDLGQTITFVQERTTATWGNGTKLVNAEDKTFELKDTVHYKGLIPGKEYTQTGTVMNQVTGEPLMQDGQPVTSSVTFTPQTSEGDVEIVFNINTSALAGETFVVFEDLYYNGVKIATHSDLKDKNQTVYVPKIGTMATSKDDEKTLSVGKKVVLVDTVEYENLIKGEEYTLKGEVVRKSKNGKYKVIEKGKAKFTADDSGNTKIEFKINTAKLEGEDLVVFEEVYDSFGNLVAMHKDIDDKDQTVSVEEVPRVPRTGDIPWWFLLGNLMVATGICLNENKKRQGKKIK